MRLHVTNAYADIRCGYVNADEEDSRGEDEKPAGGPERAALTGSCTDRGFLCRNWLILGITNDEPLELSSQVVDSCHDGGISDASPKVASSNLATVELTAALKIGFVHILEEKSPRLNPLEKLC